jgi:hypothetical protein
LISDSELDSTKRITDLQKRYLNFLLGQHPNKDFELPYSVSIFLTNMEESFIT